MGSGSGWAARKRVGQRKNVGDLRDQLHVADLEAAAQLEEMRMLFRILRGQLEAAKAGAWLQLRVARQGVRFVPGRWLGYAGAGTCVWRDAACVARQSR